MNFKFGKRTRGNQFVEGTAIESISNSAWLQDKEKKSYLL